LWVIFPRSIRSRGLDMFFFLPPDGLVPVS
jgi:hypothetical protein